MKGIFLTVSLLFPTFSYASSGSDVGLIDVVKNAYQSEIVDRDELERILKMIKDRLKGGDDSRIPEIPDVEIPDGEIPDVEIPDVEIPDSDIPDGEVPDVGIEIPEDLKQRICELILGNIPDDGDLPEGADKIIEFCQN